MMLPPRPCARHPSRGQLARFQDVSEVLADDRLHALGGEVHRRLAVRTARDVDEHLDPAESLVHLLEELLQPGRVTNVEAFDQRVGTQACESLADVLHRGGVAVADRDRHPCPR